jgi:mono/diheme cytochrome c family protein
MNPDLWQAAPPVRGRYRERDKAGRSSPGYDNKESPLRPFLIALLFASLSAPALAQDEFKQLPEGAGRAETVKVCAQCHSPELVANQRLDEPGWRQLVNQMANNGAQGTDAEFEAIIKYLATTFPPN